MEDGLWGGMQDTVKYDAPLIMKTSKFLPLCKAFH